MILRIIFKNILVNLYINLLHFFGKNKRQSFNLLNDQSLVYFVFLANYLHKNLYLPRKSFYKHKKKERNKTNLMI